MARVVRLLQSPRTALSVLGFLVLYCAIGSWLPWAPGSGQAAPAWATAVGLDRPFAAAPFVAAVALLFASTLACTWPRLAVASRRWRGLAGTGRPLVERPGVSLAGFLRRRGLARRGTAFTRARVGVWGGVVLHLGLLVLMAGVVAQQALSDRGAFELAVGEEAHLADEGAVFRRWRGTFAPAEPPDLRVALVQFDPFLHQPGYAPDRAARLRVQTPGREPLAAAIDRARGVNVEGGVTVYLGLPAGLALVLEEPGRGRRVVHLHEDGPREAVAELGSGTLGVTSERAIDDPLGTGDLICWFAVAGVRRTLRPDEEIPLAEGPGRVVGVVRWAGFTYARSPGMVVVYAGFALIVAGAGLLSLPTVVVRVADAGGIAGWVVAARDAELLTSEWERWGPPPHDEGSEA